MTASCSSPDAATLTINGNFSKDATATFDPGNDFSDPATGGTVVFGPGDNTITTDDGVVDFYNLTKESAGGETLSVEANTADVGGIHILNTLTLRGADGSNLLSLASMTPASQWGIWAEGAVVVNFVDVQEFQQYRRGRHRGRLRDRLWQQRRMGIWGRHQSMSP